MLSDHVNSAYVHYLSALVKCANKKSPLFIHGKPNTLLLTSMYVFHMARRGRFHMDSFVMFKLDESTAVETWGVKWNS